MRSARLIADIAPDGAEVEVRVDYTVSAAGDLAGPLRLEVLGFGPTSVETVRVESLRVEAIRMGTPSGEPGIAGVEPAGRAPGTAATSGGAGALADTGAVRLTPEGGRMRAGELRLPIIPATADAVALSLVYRVAGAVERSGAEVRMRVPVVVLDLPPEQGSAPVFHASVRVPDGWSVSGGFPTGLAPTAGGPWEVELPVVPALVSLRGRSDGTRRPGLPETLDAVALIIILGFGLVGWRHLREVVRAGESASPGTASSPRRRRPPGGPESPP